MVKVIAHLVIEIMGKPSEHVKEALNTLVIKIGSDKGVKITNKNYYDPKPLENSDSLFTAFAELEAEFESLEVYLQTVFMYMPSHTEIVEPTSLTMDNAHLNDVANTIIRKLHNYDAIAKKAVNEREFLIGKLHEVAPHLFKKAPPQSIQDKASNTKSKKKKTTKKKKK